METPSEPTSQPDDEKARHTTEGTLLKQIREHDRVFRDALSTTHRLISVTYDNEVSGDGDLTRRITLLLEVGDVTKEPRYVWRIPHNPYRPPFAVDVSTRPQPLPYLIKLVSDEPDIYHSEIEIDLSGCRPHAVYEFKLAYSQEDFIEVVRQHIFSTTRTFVWSYTFVSDTNYFDIRVRFPRGANVRIEQGASTLTSKERIAEIDGRTVYSYSYWSPRAGGRVNGSLTYRVWSRATGPTIAVASSILVAIPAAFAAGIALGTITLVASLVVTGLAHWLTHRFG